MVTVEDWLSPNWNVHVNGPGPPKKVELNMADSARTMVLCNVVSAPWRVSFNTNIPP